MNAVHVLLFWAPIFTPGLAASQARGVHEGPAAFSWGDLDADGLSDALAVTPEGEHPAPPSRP